MCKNLLNYKRGQCDPDPFNYYEPDFESQDHRVCSNGSEQNGVEAVCAAVRIEEWQHEFL